jgi:type I restriction enzyme S subunit
LDLAEIAEFELFAGEFERYALRAGDLLVVEGNGSLSEIGRAALWHGEIAECVHQNHLIRVRPTDVLPAYLELYWDSPVASRAIADLAVTTAGLYNLSVGKIARVPVAVPPYEEQQEIVRRVKATLGNVDRLVGNISSASAALDGAVRGALAKAFRGELVPTDADQIMATREASLLDPEQSSVLSS